MGESWGRTVEGRAIRYGGVLLAVAAVVAWWDEGYKAIGAVFILLSLRLIAEVQWYRTRYEAMTDGAPVASTRPDGSPPSAA